MRKNYPLLSQEINDIFQDVYYKLVYIIGYDDENGDPKYKGKYDEYNERIRRQVYTLIFDLLGNTTHQVYRTWGRHIARNELRRR